MLFRRKCRKFCHTFDCLKKPRIVPVQKSKTPEKGVLQTPRKVWDRLGLVSLPREFWKNQRSCFSENRGDKECFSESHSCRKEGIFTRYVPKDFPSRRISIWMASFRYFSMDSRGISGRWNTYLSDKCLSLLFLLFPFFLGRSAAAARGKSIYTPSDVTDQYPRKTILRNALRERAFVAVFPGYTHANPPNGYAHESVNSTKPPSPP